MEEEISERRRLNNDHRSAWDPKTMGHGKHSYRAIDPDTINPDDYARNLAGEETKFGDVRQYNSAQNEKHPENDVDLDWLGRVGSVFHTEAPGFEGTWQVTNMPLVKSPEVYCRATQTDQSGSLQGEERTIPCMVLGCTVDGTNHFAQVKTTLVQRGKVDRNQRIKLTKR